MIKPSIAKIQHQFRLSTKQIILVMLFTSFITFVFAFKWDWLKPFLISYISQKSERVIKIGKLDVAFSGILNPTVKFEDLYIQNAKWAGARPLVAAKRISFTLNALQFLSNKQGKVVYVSMSDAEVNLERLSDGLRNWRLLKPNYKGPGKYVLLSLTVERSKVRFENHALDLNVTAEISPNLTSKVLPNKVMFFGHYHQKPFNGVLLSDVKLTFQKTKEHFNIDGYAIQGKNKVTIVGKVGDVYKNLLIDADLKLSGNIFSLISLAANNTLKGQNSFNLNSHLIKVDNKYQLNQFAGNIDSSDLKGDISYIDDKKEPQLIGKLSSQVIDFKKFNGLIKQLKTIHLNHMQSNIELSEHKTLNLGDKTRLLERLKKSHLNLIFNIKNVINTKMIKLAHLNIIVAGDAGKYQMKIADSLINKGHLSVHGWLNVAQNLPMLKATLTINDLQVGSLLSNTNLNHKVSAPLAVKAEFNSKGSSLLEMTSNLSGNAKFSVGKGVISNKLDAKLGLDLGKVVWLSIKGDKDISLHCGVLDFKIEKGIATSNYFWVNTAQTLIDGQGILNLKNQHFDILLDPQPKNPSLFVKDSSVQFSGQFNNAKSTIKTSANKPRKSTQNFSNRNCDNR